MWFRLVVAFVVATTTMGVGGSGAVAENLPPGPGTPGCSAAVTADGFDVSWSADIAGDRYVIERKAFSRFWWRGRSGDQSGTASDSPAPRNAASVEYRVVVKTDRGETLGVIPCVLESSPGFGCTVSQAPDGSFDLGWSGQAGGPSADVVVRRTVRPGGDLHWRLRTTADSMIDGPSPTGTATYHLFARIDRRISAHTRCLDVAPPVGACGGAVTQLPEPECEALYDLNALGLGEADGSDPCTWQGITCTDGHVEHLEIRHRFVSGSIPASLGDLHGLRSLILFSTLLTGPIPGELGNLTSLEYLELAASRLTGPIPTELSNLENLEILDLSNNRLSGSVPVELGNLGALTSLDLGTNRLSGSIPVTLTTLADLEELVLVHNRLSGPIPAELGGLTNLRYLLLSVNELSGAIPAELGNLDDLQHLTLHNNRLTGDITVPMTGLMDNVTELRLADGAGFNNCLTATDPIVASWLSRESPGWDDCE